MRRTFNLKMNVSERNTGGGRCASLPYSPARILMWIFVSIALIPLLAMPAQAADWKGEEVQKDGVLHVLNPNKAVEPAKTVELKELWRVGGDTDDEDEFFGVIGTILTDKKGNVYLLDSQLSQVKIFSQSGEFIRNIGREGEGPGEFRSPTGMFFTEAGLLGVMQIAPGKIVLLTSEGEPAGEYPLPASEDGGFLLLLGGNSGAGNVVMAMGKNAFSEQKFETTRYLASIDAKGIETARYHEETRGIDFANALLDEMTWDTFDRRWTVGWDGRVYAVTKYQGYNIHVWNRDGKLNRIIEVDHKPRKRTQEETDLVESIYGLFTRQIPNGKLQMCEFSKDIETMFSREDGSLWVLSSEGSHDNPEGSIGVFDVFDGDGHFVRKVTLMGEGNPMTDGYYFVGDRLYVVTDLLQAAISLQAGGESFQIGDKEPEPMSVICYELDKDLRITKH
ncbi:MAG: 6-bladed beta-propeller [Candidatus Latescibacterota bacterium]